MDIYEIRRLNLLRLVGSEYGAKIKFARAHPGVNESLISQWLNKTRVMGERSTRKLEEQAGLPTGYFDSKDAAVIENADLHEIQAALDRAKWLDSSKKESIMALLKAMKPPE